MSSSKTSRMLGNNIMCIVYLCVMCGSNMEIVCAKESAAEESFVDSAKILGELVDDVSGIKQDIRLLKNVVLGQEYIRDEGDEGETLDETNDHNNSSKIRIIVSFPADDVIECRVEHGWNHVSDVLWAIKGLVVPVTRYKQIEGKDFFSITVPSAVLSNLNENKYADEFHIKAKVANITFGVTFSIPPFNESSNPASSSNIKRQSLVEEIDMNPFTVIDGTKNIEYTPGDYLEIKLHSHLNMSIYDTIYSMREEHDEQTSTEAVLRNNFDGDGDGVINVTRGQPSDSWTHVVSINTESLLEGGILSSFEYGQINRKMAFETLRIHIIQSVYMHLPTKDSPIPRERVAIVKDYFRKNQTLDLGDPESAVVCLAVGNPTPEIEFRHQGHPVQLEQIDWTEPYITTSYILFPKNVHYRQITCHAKSGKGEDDMTINLSYKMAVDEGKSGFRRLSDKLIEVTCTIIGPEAPDIYFIVNHGRKLSADDKNVQMVSTSTQNTTTSTFVYDTSDSNLWYVDCVGALDGRQERKSFQIEEY